jgi:cobalamin biosynthesis protein CobD/CbiB
MHKIGWFAAAAALSLMFVGARIASTTYAHVDAVEARIDAMRIMVEARDLPVELVVDFSTFY